MHNEKKVNVPMRSGIAAIIAVILWPSALPANEPSDEAIKGILGKTCEFWHAPGIAAAVVRDDKIIYLNGVGVRELGIQQSVTAEGEQLKSWWKNGC
jgi:hypothetical protein